MLPFFRRTLSQRFRENSLFRNIVISNVFARFGFLPWKNAIFEFVGIYGVSCMFSQSIVNTSVFEKVFQKHCKIQHFGHVVLPKCHIAVFWLHLLFWLLRKHRKYQCFGSILGLEEEKTSQIALFCSW